MIRPDPAPPGPQARQPRLDALRGAAVVWMAVFHFCFDLAHFRWTAQDFYFDPFWLHQRTAIVSGFLLIAGFSQALAMEQGLGWPRFWRRWVQVAGCALLVSLGSWLMFPFSYITFGVLHAVAVMLLLLRWWRPGVRPALALGLAAVLLPQFFQHSFFDSRWTNWLGLVTEKPATEDYVPLLPWLGVMLWGYALGRLRPALLAGPLPRAFKPLALLGQWSLSFYMLHQPILIALLTAAATMRA